MKFPVSITAKILDVSPQFFIRDANGQLIMYVKQKLLAFREKVDLFSDESMGTTLIRMRADRIIDFNANYVIETPSGQRLGSLRRRGMRSIWRASYELYRVDMQGKESLLGSISETNPWVKVVDYFVGQIPVLGMLTGLLLHPTYALTSDQGQALMTFKKMASLIERRFELQEHGHLRESDELLVVSAAMMFVVLEGERG